MKLTPKPMGILERLARSERPVLERAILGSGGRTSLIVAALRRAGYVEKCDHPSVIDRRSGYPAEALRLTNAGRQALESK